MSKYTKRKPDIGNQFFGVIVEESPRAVLFEDWFWPEPKWLPKSQTRMRHGDFEVAVVITDWFADKEGIKEVDFRQAEEGQPQ